MSFTSSERIFEDHENVVEVLSNWTRDTENKVLFLEKEEKYAVFKNPQVKMTCISLCDYVTREEIFATHVLTKP